MDNIKKCDFCGRPAIKQFKTGKRSWCCSNNVAQCPAIRSRNSEKAKKRPHPKHSEETKEKIRQSNLGLKRSEETKAKLRKPKSEEHKRKLSIIAQNRSQEHKDKIAATLKRKYASGELKVWCDGKKGLQEGWNKGKPRSQATKDKISKTRKERLESGDIVITEEQKRKIGDAHLGRKRSEETKRKMSLAAMGEKSSQWKGGIAHEPYCEIWADKEYKADIRERDGNVCQNTDCWKTSDKICIHHIDYDKKNCPPQNLITICFSCNSRANTDREHWTAYYRKILSKKYGYEY